MTQENEPWHQFVARLLDQRDRDHGMRANVSRGLVESTESYAYPYVLPYAQNSREDKPLLKGCAIIAHHVATPQLEAGARQSLGRTLAIASFRMAATDGSPYRYDPAKSDAIAQRLKTLEQQPLADAAVTIDRLLTLGEKLEHPVPVDYYGIIRLLLRWGNGISDASLAVRRSVQREYYSGAAISTDSAANQQTSTTTKQ